MDRKLVYRKSLKGKQQQKEDIIAAVAAFQIKTFPLFDMNAHNKIKSQNYKIMPPFNM